MLMSSAVELVLIFIALEISSIATYILAGFRRRAAISIESSVKYFLLGSFATAFFLYGIALMFGATGSTSVYTIANMLTERRFAAGLRRRGTDVRWTRLQDRRRALPHLDARRLRRRARSGRGAHVHRSESRCLCRPAARPLRDRRSCDGSGWSGSRRFSP